eukprot:NODE_7_length_4287_cov_44.299519_g6_i0.p1 GENE.NODE_7_length_4287_cov_44.299519_g6_i0~~NODE_7_length_4287_cov_44.299519_g6_i0.p1  ORF type:complete len:1396 (-),score=498.52 NODE_7_length_4287_cov_44.299519_g6_i0:98-3715(-)
MADLGQKKAELKAVDDRIEVLQRKLDENMKKKSDLEEEYTNTETKLGRAKRLMSGLGGEKTRYVEQSEMLAEAYSNIIGDVLVSAGAISYLGPFTNDYRQAMVTQWVDLCKQKNIPGSQNFELDKFLGDAVRIQEWKLLGLPSEAFSVDNALIMTNARRWPLLIDPQGQANLWVKNMERNNKLVVLRPSESDYHKSIAAAISKGIPVLLENVDEEIDPILEPLLLKQVFNDGGMYSITIGDATVEYNNNFRFYMTTKLPRPHYKPEISTKVALVNFMITPVGLQDQLLQKVVAFEERELEDKKQKYVQQSAINKAKLKSIEDDILRGLSTVENLLDNEEVLNTLDNSKVIADEISAKQNEIETFEKVCDKTRFKFLPVATRASALFFCTTEMGNIDPMYQWSLQWYIDLFCKSLKDSEPAPENRDLRIDIINNHFQYALYRHVCRSLFAKDKLLFSFLMSIKLMETVDAQEFRFLLTGGLDTDVMVPPPPASWLDKKVWTMLCRSADQLPNAFRRLPAHIQTNLPLWKEVYESPTPHLQQLPEEWENNPLRKLVIIRMLRPDCVIPAIAAFVTGALDERYVNPPLNDLEDVFMDSPDPWTPLIFILSPGADPLSMVQTFAERPNIGMGNRLETLSLGQGQDTRASKMIQECKHNGSWILLQNCHLYADWMPNLQRTIEDYSREDNRNSINRQFRLWLTSMPTETFPVTVLQNGSKMIMEPPKGLRANLLRSFTGDPLSEPKFFQACTKQTPWKKLVFGLCFFHAVVQERRAFGPLGWNIPYEFNETDLSISIRQLQMLLNENQDIPYDALVYLTGHCNYGGRVTDEWDRRTLLSILTDYFTDEALGEKYSFAEGPEYLAPRDGTYDSYVEYIKSLPVKQKPDIFGLHANADITKDERDARMLLEAALSTQPRTASGSGDAEEKAKNSVLQVAKELQDKLRGQFDVEDALQRYPLVYANSMNTVLIQELGRYNRLIAEVDSSIEALIKAIKGEVVMSSQLEDVFNAMYDGRIPKLWMNRSYPSLKPLGAYVADLMKRLKFFESWLESGPPPVFWLSGFFFTQSFLTGVLQNYARQERIEIDTLKWDYTVMDHDSYDKPPKDGCYVSGLYLQGAGWDHQEKVLCESESKVLFLEFPIVWLKPLRQEELHRTHCYECPVYKTSERRGILSTTGHSTNFVMVFKLPIHEDHDDKHWIKRGTALLCQLDY